MLIGCIFVLTFVVRNLWMHYAYVVLQHAPIFVIDVVSIGALMFEANVVSLSYSY